MKLLLELLDLDELQTGGWQHQLRLRWLLRLGALERDNEVSAPDPEGLEDLAELGRLRGALTFQDAGQRRSADAGPAGELAEG